MIIFSLVLFQLFGNSFYNTSDPTSHDIHKAESCLWRHNQNAVESMSNNDSDRFILESQKSRQAEWDARQMRETIERNERLEKQRQNQNDQSLFFSHIKPTTQGIGIEPIEPGVLVNEIHFCDKSKFIIKYVTLPPKRPMDLREGESNTAREMRETYTYFFNQFFQVAAVFETAYERSGKKQFSSEIKTLSNFAKNRCWNNIASLHPFKMKAGKKYLVTKLDDWIIRAQKIKDALN